MDERHGDDERELARRLEAYAEARLRPDPDAMTRIRSVVVAEARRGAGPTPFRRRPAFRFGLALLAAAALLVAITGSAFASQAGGPLYGARLWVETLTLPAGSSARAEAQITRLDARLQELQTALAAHDGGAVAAALDAYRSILADTLATTPQSDALDHRLEAAISKHLAVLKGLLRSLGATAPPQALDGLQNAIDRSDNGLQQLERRGTSGQPSGQPSARPTTPPGQASTPPGQASTPPGQQKSPAATTPPGQASTPPGQASTPPGQQSSAPNDMPVPKPSPSPRP